MRFAIHFENFKHLIGELNSVKSVLFVDSSAKYICKPNPQILWNKSRDLLVFTREFARYPIQCHKNWCDKTFCIYLDMF